MPGGIHTCPMGSNLDVSNATEAYGFFIISAHSDIIRNMPTLLPRAKSIGERRVASHNH